MIVRHITRQIYTSSMSLPGDSLVECSLSTNWVSIADERASHLHDGIAIHGRSCQLDAPLAFRRLVRHFDGDFSGRASCADVPVAPLVKW